MRPLVCLLLVLSLPAFAQEDPQPPGDEAPEMMRPGSDSPEAVRPPTFDGQRKRAQAFLIPMDEAARAPTTRVAQAIEQVLLHTRRYEVVDLGRAMSVEATAEEGVRADEGRKLAQEGNDAAAAKSFPEAALKYQRALHAYDQGLPAVAAREYAEALLRYGAAEWMSGEDKQAREAFALFARIDGRQKLDPAAVEPEIVSQVAEARALAAKAKHGALEIEARPSGARVQVDGEPRGPAPTRLELAPGKHLVRVERAGFYPWSQLVEISSRKTARQGLTLVATPTAASLSQIIAGASDEVSRGGSGRNVLALAQKFSLDRLMIGSVRSLGEGHATVLIALVDARGQRVVGSKSMQVIADGTDADQIENDTQEVALAIIAGDTDDAPATDLAPKPEPATRAVMPGTAPSADDPGLVAHERRVAIPVAATDPQPAAQPATATTATTAAAQPADQPAPKKKDKTRGLRNKTGTEDWGDDQPPQQSGN